MNTLTLISPPTVRRDLSVTDRTPVHRLLTATGFFNPEELEVAMELVDDRLALGEESHYRFLGRRTRRRGGGLRVLGSDPRDRRVGGSLLDRRRPALQGIGVGRTLLAEAESWMAESGRPRVYLETAGRAQYAPTRAFYLACGYHVAAELEDFYAPGDSRVTFLKVLDPANLTGSSTA